MDFFFYSPVAFEKWDWRNSVEKGIGGSETSHVEMAWRLAARGHNVTTYAPIPDNCPGEWRKTKWYPIEAATFTEPGIWVVYRSPETIDKFNHKRDDQKIWFIMQDWDYDWTDNQIKNTDKIITLCKAHGEYVIGKHPLVKRNLWLTSNGVKIDLIEEIEAEGIERNPYRVMHASSPDRGLKQALISFKKAKVIVPELEFHAFYGFNNIDKMIAANPKGEMAKLKAEIIELLDQPGVTFHGRVSQNELYREWFKSGIYIYETNFFETSNIASQEAQCMGAVPIFSPIFAQRENIKHGIAVNGDSYDPLTNSRFAAELVKLATRHDLQESIRGGMMTWARQRFNWEVFVTQWEMEAEDRRKEFESLYSFPEQL